MTRKRVIGGADGDVPAQKGVQTETGGGGEGHGGLSGHNCRYR